jgi:hypothetical protein
MRLGVLVDLSAREVCTATSQRIRPASVVGGREREGQVMGFTDAETFAANADQH